MKNKPQKSLPDKTNNNNWFNRHKVTACVLLVFLGGILPFFLLEAGSYIFGKFPAAPDPLVTDRHQHWTEIRQYDHLLFWKLKPNVKRGAIETNPRGLRSSEIPRRKRNEFRILSLGESSTFGLGIKAENTYSGRIERDMKHFQGRPLRVINAGIPGYSLFQAYIYLKHRGVKLKPDVVMIYFGYNDFLPVGYLGRRDALYGEDTAGLNDWELFDQRQHFLRRTDAFLARQSNFYRGIKTLFPKETDRHIVRENSGKVRVPADHRRRLLVMFDDFCQENRIKFIILIPWYLHFIDHIPLLREFAKEHDVPLVDLPDKLRSLPLPKKRYFRDSLHPNARGHKLIAEAIEGELQRFWPDEEQPASDQKP